MKIIIKRLSINLINSHICLKKNINFNMINKFNYSKNENKIENIKKIKS